MNNQFSKNLIIIFFITFFALSVSFTSAWGGDGTGDDGIGDGGIGDGEIGDGGIGDDGIGGDGGTGDGGILPDPDPATLAPTCSLIASPASIITGSNSSISWSSSNATSAYISPTIVQLVLSEELEQLVQLQLLLI